MLIFSCCNMLSSRSDRDSFLNKVHNYPDHPSYEQPPYQGDYCLSRHHRVQNYNYPTIAFWQVSRAAATHYSNHSNVNRCSNLTPSFVTLSSCTGTWDHRGRPAAAARRRRAARRGRRRWKCSSEARMPLWGRGCLRAVSPPYSEPRILKHSNHSSCWEQINWLFMHWQSCT